MPQIEILNTDCMDYMRDLEDNAFDLAIVDPPYGVGSITYMPWNRINTVGGFIDRYDIMAATIDKSKQIPNFKQTGYSIGHTGNTPGTNTAFVDQNTPPPPDYFRELFRVSVHQIIFGGNYYIIPPSRCWICWRKTNVPADGSFSLTPFELAWTSFSALPLYVEANPQSRGGDKRFHPTQKPVDLYAQIITRFAKRGYRILDTHLGSGSSAIAAHDAGLDFVGTESSPSYHAAALARYNRHAAQTTLNLTPPTEQPALDFQTTNKKWKNNQGKQTNE